MKHNIYVDDFLGSAGSPELGARLAKDVHDVLAAGDFHLVGWSSNSVEVLAAVGTEMSSGGGSNLLGGEDSPDVLLGVTWRTATDTIGFRVSSADDVQYTRVSVLSKLASQYDPLGTAGPIIVKVKIKARTHCTKGLGWTDPLDDED